MTTRMRTPSSDERGAILVHVAFLLIAVMALTTFVVDFGALWVARRQAQNAADASALAGAISLAFDSPDYGRARASALAVSQHNLVWGEAPSVTEGDVIIGLCPDGVNTCVRVNAYRSSERGNALPTFFGQLVGIDSQNVRATATAMVQPANATACLKPWGIPDRWNEVITPPFDDQTSTYDAYYTSGPNKGQLLPIHDIYIPPGAGGTGYTVEADYGASLILKQGNPNAVRPGFYQALALGPGTGASQFRENISQCNGVTWAIGQRIPLEPGNMVGPTGSGVADLVALDPGARWVGGDSPIEGSCVTNNTCPQFTMSPRIVAVPIYDTDLYAKEDAGGRTSVLVVNILGFFVDGMQGNSVVGHVMTGPGIYDPNYPPVPGGWAFLHTVTMVR